MFAGTTQGQPVAHNQCVQCMFTQGLSGALLVLLQYHSHWFEALLVGWRVVVLRWMSFIARLLERLVYCQVVDQGCVVIVSC